MSALSRTQRQTGLSQTSIIAAAFVIAFIVFVTTKGELPQYLALLGIGGK